ncbi:MAG: FeoB-associated Cys-rich membrane protein [Clostridia bacterium]|nr:FeoB-associated Cys-rich membrane protein [Clostridia bacterium]
MSAFFTDNAGTILITLALAGLVTLIILRLRKDRRRGKSSCGCNCGSCPMAGSCHRNG